MTEYHVIITRLQGKQREDEESTTDLLNERSRAGWSFRSAHTLDNQRLMLVFARDV